MPVTPISLVIPLIIGDSRVFPGLIDDAGRIETALIKDWAES